MTQEIDFDHSNFQFIFDMPNYEKHLLTPKIPNYYWNFFYLFNCQSLSFHTVAQLPSRFFTTGVPKLRVFFFPSFIDTLHHNLNHWVDKKLYIKF